MTGLSEFRLNGRGRRSPRACRGMSMVEIAMSLMILVVIFLSLAASILGAIKMEMLAREVAIIQQGLSAELEGFYSLNRDSILARHLQSFDLSNPGSDQLLPVDGSDSIGTIYIREVDPSNPAVELPESSYFEVLAVGRWDGMSQNSQAKVRIYVRAD